MDRPKSNDPGIRAAAIASLADECAAWGGGDVPSWKETLSTIYFNENGFEIARDLDRFSRVAGIDADLVEILDGASSHLWTARDAAVLAWVESEGIKPTLSIGDRVTSLHGTTGRINDMRADLGVYLVAPDGEEMKFQGGGGVYVPYEEATLLADQPA